VIEEIEAGISCGAQDQFSSSIRVKRRAQLKPAHSRGEKSRNISVPFLYAAQIQPRLRRLMVKNPPRSLTYAIVERYVGIRRRARLQGHLIGGIDPLIAATAIDRNVTLLTTDSDCTRAPTLNVQPVAHAPLA
jgi:hypothetical protein